MSNLLHTPVREVAASAERTVRLEGHVVFVAPREELAPVFQRAELHLIHDRLGLGDRRQLVELARAVVRDANRARMAAFMRTFHSPPRPGRPASRPVDDVQVDLLEPKPIQAPLDLGLRVFASGVELRGDEDLVARHAAVAEGTADALLVAVGLRGVDVAVAELQRPANRVLAVRPVRDLPDTKAEKRDLVAVGEHAGAPIRGYGSGLHCKLLVSGKASQGAKARA